MKPSRLIFVLLLLLVVVLWLLPENSFFSTASQRSLPTPTLERTEPSVPTDQTKALPVQPPKPGDPTYVSARKAARTGARRNSGVEDQDEEIKRMIIPRQQQPPLLSSSEEADILKVMLASFHALRAKQQQGRKLIEQSAEHTQILIPAFASTKQNPGDELFAGLIGVIGEGRAKQYLKEVRPQLRKLFLGFGMSDVTMRYECQSDGRGNLTVTCGKSEFSFSGSDIPIEYSDLIRLE